MKMINKINYEQFAIDYLEGNLSGNLLVEMNQFLAANSDIKEELEEMKLYYLEADEEVVFEGKDDLIRPVGGKKKFIIRPLFLMTSIVALFIVMIGFFLFPSINPETNITKTTLETTNNNSLVIDNNNNNTSTNNTEEITEDFDTQKDIIVQQNNDNKVSNQVKNEVIILKNEKPSQPLISKPKNISTKKTPVTIPNKTIPSNPIIRIIESVSPSEIQDSEPIALTTEPNTNTELDVQGENINLEPLQLASLEINSPEITLENSLSITENPMTQERESILRRTGLLPEKENRKISFRNIKEALTPEFFASKD